MKKVHILSKDPSPHNISRTSTEWCSIIQTSGHMTTTFVLLLTENQ